MERDYIKSNNEKKKKKSIFCFKFNNNRTFIPTVSRIFQNGMRTFSLSLSFFLYLYISFCIYFCCKFIIFSPGSLRLFCFHPISSDFTRRPFVSFTARTFRLIRFLFANSSGSHLGRKKFDGFKIRFGQKSAVSRLSELAFIFARFALFHRLCFQLPPFFPVSFFFL